MRSLSSMSGGRRRGRHEGMRPVGRWRPTNNNARQPARDDGGRAAAGFKGKTGDCVTRAIAIATGKPYREVYDALNEHAHRQRKRGKSNARTGVYKVTRNKYLATLGWKWTPTMQIGSGCKVHLRADELPSGRLVVGLSRHDVAVIDGVIHDTHDCSRNGDAVRLRVLGGAMTAYRDALGLSRTRPSRTKPARPARLRSRRLDLAAFDREDRSARAGGGNVSV
jgi:hypothetical protein